MNSNKKEKSLKPRLHRHMVYSVIEALQDVFVNDYHADKVIQFHLKKNKKWGSRDHRFFAESVYDIVRWWRRLAFVVGIQDIANAEIEKEDVWWKVFAAWYFEKNQELPAWDEFSSLKTENFDFGISQRSIRESIPDWIDELVAEELGADKWEKALAKLNSPADVILRTNTLLIKRDDLVTELEKEGVMVETVANSEVALRLKERKNVFITESFHSGFFEVQDGASQCIVPLLQLRPGMRVVDACAGAGGKSLQIASEMQNKGKVIALDIHEKKLSELKKRARRGKIDIIETRTIESTKVIKRLKEKADRVLLDVPCSGLGVIRRNPDTKWKLTKEKLDEVNETQKMILNQYSQILKPEGRLVYSTCSILPSENEVVVQNFLNENSGWSLIEEKRWWPDVEGFDGFYAAVLERKK